MITTKTPRHKARTKNQLNVNRSTDCPRRSLLSFSLCLGVLVVNAFEMDETKIA